MLPSAHGNTTQASAALALAGAACGQAKQRFRIASRVRFRPGYRARIERGQEFVARKREKLLSEQSCPK
jgi:hypothetical protein